MFTSSHDTVKVDKHNNQSTAGSSRSCQNENERHINPAKGDVTSKKKLKYSRHCYDNGYGVL